MSVKNIFLVDPNKYSTERNFNLAVGFHLFLCSGFVCGLIILAIELLQQNPLGSQLTLLWLVLNFIWLLLNRKGYNVLASGTFCVVSTLFLTFLNLNYAEINNLMFCYTIILMVGITFGRREIYKFLFLIFLCICYAASAYWTQKNGHFSPFEFSTQSNTILLIAFLFSGLILIFSITKRFRVSTKRIQDLVGQLQKSNSELVQSNEKLRAFGHLVSHDLKAPLNSIQGFANLAKAKSEDKVEGVANYFDIINSNVKQMRELINDTLQKSLIEEDTKSKKPVNLNNVVDKLKLILSAEYPDLEIISDALPTVLAHYTEIFKIFKNLLENGAKYNRSKPKLTIGYEQTSKYVKISFKDNGIGIEANEYDKIFDKSYRVENNEFKGTGLGLSIVKETVEEMGGTIKVGSQINTGSEFVLTFDVDILVGN